MPSRREAQAIVSFPLLREEVVPWFFADSILNGEAFFWTIRFKISL
jgi:hypothetical protein